eukprot:5564512-Amphidinium_carterae.1
MGVYDGFLKLCGKTVQLRGCVGFTGLEISHQMASKGVAPTRMLSMFWLIQCSARQQKLGNKNGSWSDRVRTLASTVRPVDSQLVKGLDEGDKAINCADPGRPRYVEDPEARAQSSFRSAQAPNSPALPNGERNAFLSRAFHA